MKNSAKGKRNVHVAPIVGRGHGPDGPPLGSPPPVRSTDPPVKNTPSPGAVRCEGDAASQASPSGDHPPYRTKQ